VLADSFLDQVVTRKGSWSDVTAEQRGVYTAYHWTGRGRDGLEVAYGAAEKRPNATVVREVWQQRHGRAAIAADCVDLRRSPRGWTLRSHPPTLIAAGRLKRRST
jgi:hypothetical protein